MKQVSNLTDLQACLCLLCDEAFFAKEGDLNIHCPKCGNKEPESLIFQPELEEDEQIQDQPVV